MNGYTEVWSGSASQDAANQLLATSQQWQSLVGSDKLRTKWDEDNNFAFWVANEFIDWEHYRKSGEYVPLGAKTVRAIKRGQPMPYDFPNPME